MSDWVLSWVHTDLATALTNAGAVALAFVVWGAVLLAWVTLRRRRTAHPGRAAAPVAADVPSGPMVSGAELLAATLVRPHRPEPYVWRNRYEGGNRPRSTFIACDKTTVDLPVDEVRRIAEEVAG